MPNTQPSKSNNLGHYMCLILTSLATPTDLCSPAMVAILDRSI